VAKHWTGTDEEKLLSKSEEKGEDRMATESEGVFIIYTGGTIGSMPQDLSDPLSPLIPYPLDKVMERLPAYSPRDKKIALSGRWIRLETYSWEYPLDSSNMTSRDWRQIAEIVKDNYDSYEGFVVLQGTDTLAYTSSALAFMLDHLSKPLVITGSQKPIGETRSDAVQNLVTAIEVAAARSLGRPVIPEVCVFFRDKVTRGCRTTKLSASDYDAFYSPNYPPLATAGADIIVIGEAVARKPSSQNLSVRLMLEENIASIDIFPGMSHDLLKNILMTQGLRGVVLQTFGSGNAPTTPQFLDTIGRAIEAGRVIVDVTQCRSGTVELGRYDVSAGLLERGVVSGMDMTPEAALTKLAVLLGQEQDPDIARDLVQLNFRGEQRQSIFNLHYPGGSLNYDEALALEPSRPMTEGPRYRPNELDQAIFRLVGLELTEGKRGRIELKAYIDMPDANENTKEEGNPHFLGRSFKRYNGDEGAVSMFLRMDQQACDFIDPSYAKSITLVNMGAPLRWSKLNIALYMKN
jgi:L-asparaginase